jgi:small nuclear ribonucleoprotein (snRNP)-like protein
MTSQIDTSQIPSELLDREVVLDLAAPYVYVGTLIGEDSQHLILQDADAHDLRDTSTTRDLYVLDCRKHGIGVNRKRVYVRKSQIVSISRLEDVVP